MLYKVFPQSKIIMGRLLNQKKRLCARERSSQYKYSRGKISIWLSIENTSNTFNPLWVECSTGGGLSYRREMFLSRLYIESTSIVPRIKLSFRRGLRERESISREGGFPPCATPRLPLPRQGSGINAMFRLENRHFARTFFKISFLKFYNSFSSGRNKD